MVNTDWRWKDSTWSFNCGDGQFYPWMYFLYPVRRQGPPGPAGDFSWYIQGRLTKYRRLYYILTNKHNRQTP